MVDNLPVEQNTKAIKCDLQVNLMLAADSRICFLCCFYFFQINIKYYYHCYFVPASVLHIQFNYTLEFNYFQVEVSQSVFFPISHLQFSGKLPPLYLDYEVYYL